MATPSLVGKKVTITSKNHTDEGSWGVVKAFDGDQYHVAICGDENAVLVFDRDEFKVSRSLNQVLAK